MPPPGPQFSNHFEKTYLQVMRVMRFWWSGMAAGPLHRDDIHWVRSPDGVLLWMSYTDIAKGSFFNAPSEWPQRWATWAKWPVWTTLHPWILAAPHLQIVDRIHDTLMTAAIACQRAAGPLPGANIKRLDGILCIAYNYNAKGFLSHAPGEMRHK